LHAPPATPDSAAASAAVACRSPPPTIEAARQADHPPRRPLLRARSSEGKPFSVCCAPRGHPGCEPHEGGPPSESRSAKEGVAQSTAPSRAQRSIEAGWRADKRPKLRACWRCAVAAADWSMRARHCCVAGEAVTGGSPFYLLDVCGSTRPALRPPPPHPPPSFPPPPLPFPPPLFPSPPPPPHPPLLQAGAERPVVAFFCWPWIVFPRPVISPYPRAAAAIAQRSAGINGGRRVRSCPQSRAVNAWPGSSWVVSLQPRDRFRFAWQPTAAPPAKTLTPSASLRAFAGSAPAVQRGRPKRRGRFQVRNQLRCGHCAPEQ